MSFEPDHVQEITDANLGETVPGYTELTPQAVLDARQAYADWDAEEFGESPTEIYVNSPDMIPPEALDSWNKQFHAE